MSSTTNNSRGSTTSKPTVNGQKFHLQAVDHIASYPFVSDVINIYKDNPIGNASIDITNAIYANLVAPFLPLLETPYSFVAPIVEQADHFGDGTLNFIDEQFPAVKEMGISDLKNHALDAAVFPFRAAQEMRDYVFDVWSDEYNKTARENDGRRDIFTYAWAMLSTELRIASESLRALADYIQPKTEEAVARYKEARKVAHDKKEQAKQYGHDKKEQGKQTAHTYLQYGQDQVNDALNYSQQQADQALRLGQQKIQDADRVAQDKLQWSREQLEQGNRNAQDGLEQSKQFAKDKANEGEDYARDTMQWSQQKAEQGSRAAQDNLKQASRAAQDNLNQASQYSQAKLQQGSEYSQAKLQQSNDYTQAKLQQGSQYGQAKLQQGQDNLQQGTQYSQDKLAQGNQFGQTKLQQGQDSLKQSSSSLDQQPVAAESYRAQARDHTLQYADAAKLNVGDAASEQQAKLDAFAQSQKQTHAGH